MKSHIMHCNFKIWDFIIFILLVIVCIFILTDPLSYNNNFLAFLYVTHLYSRSM
jgi:hypothetical protein